MKSLILPLWAGVVATASVGLHLRQSDDSCCFGLDSIGVVDEEVTEGHTGGLTLGGPFQQGGFCFNNFTKTIRDTLNHNCFMRAPTEEFQCYAGAVGATVFDIKPHGPRGGPYLSYDNGTSVFYACPVGTGVNQYYNIFSKWKPNATECMSVVLALYDASTACSSVDNVTVPTSTSTASLSPSGPQTTLNRRQLWTESAVTASIVGGYSQVRRAGLLSSMSPSVSTEPVPNNASATALQAIEPSKACSISPSAPSIAPIKVGSPDKGSPDGIKDTSGEVNITYNSSSVLLYTIPNSFVTSQPNASAPLCALQFRMPVCTQLPEGYPCYSFSGMEQEFLANSGMNLKLILDDGHAQWNATMLHQVTPGENTVLDTFECGAAANAPYDERKMIWHVTSVRNFGLEFLQAGVGENPEFLDGIGAWIVPCQ
ncbi:hypothetical protein GGS21DRAFT_390362 [Xylaria nigripes]|nr:hypothetical protein GGS21DRAFT_390362 [Xylaria nigripes]